MIEKTKAWYLEYYVEEEGRIATYEKLGVITEFYAKLEGIEFVKKLKEDGIYPKKVVLICEIEMEEADG